MLYSNKIENMFQSVIGLCVSKYKKEIFLQKIAFKYRQLQYRKKIRKVSQTILKQQKSVRNET